MKDQSEEGSRYLHVDVARGYTHSKSSAVFDEPEALSEVDQERMSKEARKRYESEQADKIARRQAAAWLRRMAAAEKVALEYGFDVSRFQARIRGEIQQMESEVEARRHKADLRKAADDC